MRDRAVSLYQAAVKAADPAAVLRPYLLGLPVITGRYIVVSVGKAAVSMMAEAIKHLPDERFEAIAVTNYENVQKVNGCRVMAAGHPVPDKNGEMAANAVIDLVASATAEDMVLVLVSGGGSALLPAPVNGISLENKARVSELLLAVGMDIVEMNAVRQQLSRLKGGGLSRLAAPAKVKAFILSDVIGDDLRVIASGPTVSPIFGRIKVLEILHKYDVYSLLPAAVQEYLGKSEETQDTGGSVNVLIGSNRQSLEAMIAASDGGVVVSDKLVGDVAEAAEFIVRTVKENPTKVLIFGGETTVSLRGNGRGGRNQELALRVALLLENQPDWVFLSGGTDGRDGPTDAAGGIVDGGTVQRIKGKGHDPIALLENNDSYMALGAAGDLLIRGATGTNVADVQVFLRH